VQFDLIFTKRYRTFVQKCFLDWIQYYSVIEILLLYLDSITIIGRDSLKEIEKEVKLPKI